MTNEKIILPKGETIRIDTQSVTDNTFYYNINRDTEIEIENYGTIEKPYLNVKIHIDCGCTCSVWGRAYEISKDGDRQ